MGGGAKQPSAKNRAGPGGGMGIHDLPPRRTAETEKQTARPVSVGSGRLNPARPSICEINRFLELLPVVVQICHA